MNSPASPQAKRHIGQILISQGILTEDQLRIALLEQLKSRQPVGKLLVQLGFVSEATLRDALSEKLGLQPVDLGQIVVDPTSIRIVPRDFAKRHNLFPVALDKDRKRLILAISDTNNIVALDQVRAQLRGEYEVELRLAGEQEIARAIEQFYGHELSIDGILHEIETGEIDYQSLQASGDEYSQPVVRLISALLADAVERAASDIHFEPEQNFLRIRYRIDGVLHNVYQVPASVFAAMTSRIKLLGRMDVIEKRRPQDGRIKTRNADGREIELRLSTLPTAFGEKLVMRVFDPEVLVRDFAELGLHDHDLETWESMTARPNGIVLVTGPTGSGKTTTLYSTLRQLATDEVNVCTVEDPIEMVEPRFNQMQVQHGIDLSFADGIRALMRQDPDIIMVGEIRDLQTAEMAVQAALTGHLVLSTLHTNDAPSAVTRLLDLGVPSYLLNATLIGVMAQRLVRTLCESCKQEADALAEEEWNALIAPFRAARPKRVYRPVGCLECRMTGYRGRTGLYELLVLDAGLRQLIDEKPDLGAIRRRAIRSGLKPLRLAGAQKIAAGLTTRDEVLRAAPPIGDQMR